VRNHVQLIEDSINGVWM